MANNEQRSTKSLRIIACGMIAREVLAVNKQLGFDHIDLKCLPADFHHHPEKIAPATKYGGKMVVCHPGITEVAKSKLTIV